MAGETEQRFRQGMWLLQAGRQQEAAAVFEELAGAGQLEARFQLGLLCIRQSRNRRELRPQAILHLEAILRACDEGRDYPGEDRVCFALGSLYGEEAETRAQAIKIYRRGLGVNPLSAAGHDSLGLLLLESGQALGALGEFKVALQLDPGLGSAYAHLARLFFHRVRPEELAQEYAHISEEFGARAPQVLARLSTELMELSRDQAYQGLYSRGHQLKNLMGLMGSRLRGLARRARGVSPWEGELGEVAAEQEHLYQEWVKYLGAMKPEPLHPVLLDPVRVVQRALEAVRIQAGASRLRLRVQEGVPAIEVDERLLREAVVNLCLNALEALGEKGGEVTVGLGCDPARAAVFIEVEDDGPGIPAEHLGHIFDPGFTTKEQGNGYGLSIARRIAHAHHGELRVKSRLGHGTVFRLDLPVDGEAADAQASVP